MSCQTHFTYQREKLTKGRMIEKTAVLLQKSWKNFAYKVIYIYFQGILVISYHNISYHIIYHFIYIISYHNITYYIISYHVLYTISCMSCQTPFTYERIITYHIIILVIASIKKMFSKMFSNLRDPGSANFKYVHFHKKKFQPI